MAAVLCLYAVAYRPPTLNAVEGLSHRRVQLICMKNTVGCDSFALNAFISSMGLSREGTNEFEPCSWKGVECKKAHVRGIQWNGLNSRFRGNLFWLPNSLETLRAFQVRFSTPLCPRMLPPRMTYLSLIQCNLDGTLAIHCLPRNLETLNLNANLFRGTVLILDALPNLSQVDLRNNYIERVLYTSAKMLPNCAIKVDRGVAITEF
mmetsp:Transcript_33459/g.52316  ORF Transcript_33459/g.52316 Transcript_33459/m.52316 type:complete len:206 (-) Transcript_33459:48-665(-)